MLVVTRIPRARQVTLQRLWRTPDDSAALVDVLDQEQFDALEDFDVDAVAVAGSPGLWVEGSFRTTDGESAEWCSAASRTTGRQVHFVDSRSAGLLLLIVDKRTYAIGYGQGHRLLAGDEKDRRFGLEFAIRGTRSEAGQQTDAPATRRPRTDRGDADSQRVFDLGVRRIGWVRRHRGRRSWSVGESSTDPHASASSCACGRRC